jgi:hypothetical protein
MGIIDVSVNDAGLNSLDYVNSILFNFPGKAMVAVNRAAKRAGQAGKTEAKRYATRVYNIKASQFTRNTTTTVKVFGGGGGATKVIISYSGAMLDLLEFKPQISDSNGVKYQAKRGNMVHLQHAFDIQAYGGHVYERVGAPRFPVRRKLGPSTAHMVKDTAVADPLGKRIMEVFNERLSHEIGRILGK